MEEENNQNVTESRSSNIGKIIAIVLGLILVGGIVFFLMSGDDPADNSNTSTNTTTNQPSTNNNSSENTEQASKDESYTLAQVAEHNSENDCWTIINNNVYDITSYVPRHPGGDEILLACGKDGTSLFEQRETEDGEQVGNGQPHSSSARSQLSQLQIGTLKQ